MLLGSDTDEEDGFLTIGGMGGLGKTALAQLVYDNEKITREFPLRLWACVSDEKSNLDAKIILAQLLESATGEKCEGYTLEVVVSRLREILSEKRFFIFCNLVSLKLSGCSELRCIPFLGTLQHLASLRLCNLSNLEYIEDVGATVLKSGGSSKEHFPSLEDLDLLDVPKLKKWYRLSGESVGGESSIDNRKEPPQPSIFLAKLGYLSLSGCPNFEVVLHCPDLSVLELDRFMEIISNSTGRSQIRNVSTDNMAWLHDGITIRSLDLLGDKEIESIAEAWEFFRGCSSSLKLLKIAGCPKLRSLSGGLNNLSGVLILE